VTFDIQEGPRVYVERINISGNTRTLDKVIRREFRLAEGDAFSTAKVRRSQERLKNLGFFEKVDVSAAPGSSPDKTNLEVQVVEQSTGDISFGAGFSTTSGILGDISIKERNLLGKGQELRLGLSIGTLSTLIDLSFTEPYFLDRPMAAGFDIFRTSNDRQAVASYSDASLGFALRAGWAYTEHTRQTVRYTLRQTDIYNVQPFASQIVQQNAGTSVVSEVAETVAWDTRDTRVNTTKGLLIRNTLAVAGLIGTEQYFRTTADAVYYRSIFEDVVASIGGSIGAVIPYNGSSLRLNNLFFVGGDNLRGFAVGGIGPRDSITTDALGGTYFYTGTTELSFPLGLPKEIGILGKAFVDVGSLWGLGGPAQYSNTVLTSNTMRVSTGLGIQWISPFGPIRIDYAFPLVQDPWDKTENFRFGFGTRF
jgi:outer membrane protein insertion porin family